MVRLDRGVDMELERGVLGIRVRRIRGGLGEELPSTGRRKAIRLIMPIWESRRGNRRGDSKGRRGAGLGQTSKGS